MQKNKVVTWLLSYLVGLMFVASPVYGATVNIVDLPSYVTTDSFKLSCSVLPASGTAQFAYRKEGGSFSDFGPAINLSTTACQVQVSGSQVNEQTKYYFRVTVNGTDSDETTTYYDISGPSPVSGYYKEQVGSGFYKLHWKNPGDSDFSKVIIYRGETADFPADNSHEIAQVAGGANSDMTYDEHQPDPNKTYYYAIRAIDKAGNSSSLVGDSGTTVTTTTTTATTPSVGSTSTNVGQLPQEDDGSVLGSEASPTGSPETTDTTTPASKKSINKTTLGVVLAIGILAFFLFRSFKKGKI